MTAVLRQLGSSDLWVSAVGLGCWPFAGITSLGVDDRLSEETILAALDAGINFIDTAYSYGFDGRSDRVVAAALRRFSGPLILSSKVGTHYNSDRVRTIDGRPETITRHTEESLKRLGVERIDLLYLHQPDPNVAIERSAEALLSLHRRGLIRYVGLSNATVEETDRFHGVCPVVTIQPPFNMLQQSSVNDFRFWCTNHSVGMVVYWVLMKGLFAGKMSRDFLLDQQDRRRSYPMYQAEQWDLNQDFLDALRGIARRIDWNVARMVVRWSLEQPGITSCLVGAKRPEQIRETAEALSAPLPQGISSEIEDAIAHRLSVGGSIN
ncbi:MAG: ral stress protein 69 [Planctomycetota bacterium]|jgi:aryl-alcohol dehydrogenase-like predicted oxidoreductase